MEMNTAPSLPTQTTQKKYRYTVLIWLLIGGMLNYLDRSILSIAAPKMMPELGLSVTDIGLLGAFFSWSYAIMQLPSGWLIDRFGAKKLYSIGILVWSASVFFSGMASALWVFILLRVILGVGEAPCFPTSAKITVNWFAKKERGLAASIWDSSSKWGPAIAPPILIFIMITFGWRELFYFAGGIGIIFGFIFLKFYQNPNDSKRLSKEELEYIKADGAGEEQSNKSSNIKWLSLFKYRSVWGMILGFFCTIWIWNIFLVFLPLYLLDEYQISLAQMGIYASIPWIGGGIGNLTGGFMTKKMVESGFASPMKSKQILISICAVMAGISVILLPFVNNIASTIVLLTFALFFVSAITGNAWALATDVAPSSMVASVGSIQNFGGYFGGAFSPVVAGLIVQSTGSYSLAFISGGIIACCAAICYLFIVKNPIEEPAKA
ncbi:MULTISPECIES: MFS transporter [Bacillaceae]|uniref:Sugar phosphate permease n=1 Tax=Peribacillus huizhouensis TaxID=1501239 RepID=A0ABR6CSJ2_9BACI|nr:MULTISPECIES: MFS transporter [Bacillaceae]MBA9027327.1 sugar phosphate permease [Peribacillus huizhouensis]